MNKFIQFFFTTKGRVTRTQWWLLLISSNIFLWFTLSIDESDIPEGSLLFYIFALLFLIILMLFLIILMWVAVVVEIKRIRDAGYSAWFILLPIFDIIVAGFFKSVHENNKYVREDTTEDK